MKSGDFPLLARTSRLSNIENSTKSDSYPTVTYPLRDKHLIRGDNPEALVFVFCFATEDHQFFHCLQIVAIGVIYLAMSSTHCKKVVRPLEFGELDKYSMFVHPTFAVFYNISLP